MAAFWHMVWQENVHVIVMATGLFENAAVSSDILKFIEQKGYIIDVHNHFQNFDMLLTYAMNLDLHT